MAVCSLGGRSVAFEGDRLFLDNDLFQAEISPNIKEGFIRWNKGEIINQKGKSFISNRNYFGFLGRMER